MIEVDCVTALASQIVTFQNWVIGQLNQLNVALLQSQVNTVQQVQIWCEIYESSGHSIDLCGATLESINFVCNTQKENQNFGNAYNRNWSSQPKYL